jgi:hypothetical protein
MVKTAAVVRREVTDANIAQKWRAVWEWVWESFRLSCVERRRRQLSVLHFLLFRRDLGGTDLGIYRVCTLTKFYGTQNNLAVSSCYSAQGPDFTIEKAVSNSLMMSFLTRLPLRSISPKCPSTACPHPGFQPYPVTIIWTSDPAPDDVQPSSGGFRRLWHALCKGVPSPLHQYPSAYLQNVSHNVL